MEKPHTGLDDCLNMLLSCFRTKMSDKVATLPPEVDEDEDCVEPDGEGAADTADEYSDSPSDEPVTVVETEEYKAGWVDILKSQNHNKIEVGCSGQFRFWPKRQTYCHCIKFEMQNASNK